MNAKPIYFSTKEDMMKYASELASEKFNFDLNTLMRKSELIKNIRTQRKLDEY
jgi:hypothetical protein